jgi:prefoldin subunit 5|tara:strand:+ start:65 stop:274 length:210 start_codon:yes stop_codon:yes gene_type:complete
MFKTMSTVFQIRFKLLEAESSINSMETEVDCLKEQILLMREAIQEKQSYINRIRPRLEKVMTLRKDRHE